VEDLSDNEREEQLRRFWAENWLWIIGGIVLGLAIWGGIQYWQKSQLQAAAADESSYLAVLDSLQAGKRDEAVAKADALRGLHPKSPYADQVDLVLARAAVDRREFDEAARRLRVVADGSRDPQLRQIAHGRLARVLIEQGKHDEALKLLDTATAGAFAAIYHDVRGDAYAAKGDAANARREYDAALASEVSGGETTIDRAYVELKRDALPPAATAGAKS
jgi:predicted negative regulator of RcsB-dependent stress response